MSRTLTVQIDDDLYRRLAKAAGLEESSIVSFVDSAIRERLRAQPAGDASGEARRWRKRRQTLERLFELFEGHDAEAEIRRLKEQDEGF